MGSGLIITPTTLCTITGCSVLCLVCRMKSLSYSQQQIAIYTMLIGIRHDILCYLYHKGICLHFVHSAGFRIEAHVAGQGECFVILEKAASLRHLAAAILI